MTIGHIWFFFFLTDFNKKSVGALRLGKPLKLRIKKGARQGKEKWTIFDCF